MARMPMTGGRKQMPSKKSMVDAMAKREREKSRKAMGKKRSSY